MLELWLASMGSANSTRVGSDVKGVTLYEIKKDTNG